MPTFLKTIEGQVLTHVNGTVSIAALVRGKLQNSDYICLSGFMAYIQNLSRAIEYKKLTTPLLFGLANNTTGFVLEISY